MWLVLVLLFAPLDTLTFSQAKKLYFEAVDGNGEALVKSQELLRDSASSPVAQAYAGSLQLLQSDRTLALWRKGRLAKEGLEMLDRAVKAAPDNLEIRFLRAASTMHLPGFFKRSEQSEADLAQIAPRVAAAAESGLIERRIAAAALFYHGVNLQRRSDWAGAESAWRTATAIGPQTRAGIDAAAKLRTKAEIR